MAIDYDSWDKIFAYRDSIPNKKPFKRVESYIDTQNQERCTKCGCTCGINNCFDCKQENDYLKKRDLKYTLEIITLHNIIKM